MWHTGKRRFARQVCLRNPFPPFLLGIASIHSLPERGSWERQNAPPSSHYGCIMPIPSLQLQKRNVSNVKKPSVLSRSYVFKICYNAVIVLSVVLWDCCKPTNTFRDWAFSNSGLEVACQPFSCRCSQNVTHCNRRFVGHVSFQESIPAIPFGYSKHPLPARKRFLRAAVSSTCFALWLHPAHPFVAAAGKTLSDAEKQRVWSRSCGSQDLLQCSDCALSRAIWLLQTNEQLLRLSF